MTAVGIVGIFSPQQWIRQARKARDAKTSSMVLSDLMASGLRSLAAADVVTITAPHFDPVAPVAGHPAHPNVVVVAGERTEDVAEHLEAAAASMRGRWIDIAERVRGYLRDHGAPDGDAHRWDAQLATVPELAWVVAEAPDPADATESAWRLWQARRLVRDGSRLEVGGEGVDGCTLCGRREGWLKAGGRLAERWPSDLRPWETLCGPCLVVRFAVPANALGRPVRVPSVSSVAAAPWLRRLSDDPDGLEDLATAADELGLSDHRDQPVADLPDSARSVVPHLDVLYGGFERADLDDEWLEILDDARKRFRRSAGQPQRRYALVSFDGDQISALMRSRPWDERAELSQQLTRFAVETCPSIVEGEFAPGRPSHGSLLYAGGDDGRFLVAAETALDVVDALAQSFTASLDGASMSAGIAFADIRDPLDAVVDTANRALEMAKEEFGRASFCAAWIAGRSARFSGGRFEQLHGRLRHSVELVAAAFSVHHLRKGLTADIDRLAAEGWPDDGHLAFADLVRERMLAHPTEASEAVAQIEAWLRDLSPTHAAGLVRLARDLSNLEPAR